MPIVDVTIVVGRDEKDTAGLTQALADGIGRVLDSPPGQTWVRRARHVFVRKSVRGGSVGLDVTRHEFSRGKHG